jgi:serine/threonine protein kinase
VPKVIDFGIAKATQGRLTDQTLSTALEQFIGTPAYMSPEQATVTNQDVDTRSDIYSLGVLLYELLTGRTPFDQKELLATGLDEMRRIIREVEPVKPSTRVEQKLERARVGRLPLPRKARAGRGRGERGSRRIFCLPGGHLLSPALSSIRWRRGS